MTSSAPLPNVSDSIGFRAEYEKLVQEREELFQERLRLFGLKPTVYVRNLDPTTTESELKQWFQQSGAIKAVRLLLDNSMFFLMILELYMISAHSFHWVVFSICDQNPVCYGLFFSICHKDPVCETSLLD